MPEKCRKCDGDVHAKDIIKCTDCNSIFHLECAKPVKDSASKVSTRNNFKCEMCVKRSKEVTSDRSGREHDIAAVLQAIDAMRKENAESFAAVRRENLDAWTKTQEKIAKVENDVKDLSLSLGGIKKEMNEIKQNVSENAANINSLQEENFTLRDRVNELQSEVLDLQQYSRIDNIIITGIPLTSGEDMFSILADIASALSIDFNRYDVSAAHRLSSRTVQGRPPAIVVRFISRSIKANWMFARKNKKTLRANEIHKHFPDSVVYFNEHMTAHTRDIFNAGRQLVREKKLAFVWISDGRVLAKQTPMGKTVRVKSVQDMKRLPHSTQQHPTSPGPTPPAPGTAPGAAPGTAASDAAQVHTVA